MFHEQQKLSALDTSPRGATIKIDKGDIIVAGRNFGADRDFGSELSSITKLGVACIIAVAFSRRFYRIGINSGLPLIECPEAYDEIIDGEKIEIDFERWTIMYKQGSIAFNPYPDIISKILLSGGLIPQTRKSLGK
jgi:3-isopropylmalate/(R)-2-methylmalate dehydratase small subunit